MSLQEQQKRLLLACIIASVITGGVMYVVLTPSQTSTATNREKQRNSDIGPIKTPGASVQSNELWMQKINQESEIQNKKIDILEKIIHKQANHLTATENDPNQFDQLKQELAALKKQMEDQNKNGSIGV